MPMSGLKFSFCIWFTCCVPQWSLGLSPVIFIPGDGGNQLEARLNKTEVVHYICEKSSSDYFNIWLNLELLVPFVIDCWVDNMRLEYDAGTRTTRPPAGVSVRVPAWGRSEPVEWLDPSHDKAGAYFSSIASALAAQGYVRDVSMRGAPYDFRRAPNENGPYFEALKALVEDTSAANNGSAVSLVAHSMGGSMAGHFLRLQTPAWRRRYVRRLVALSTPWGGSVKALKVFAMGDDLGSRLLSGSVLRAQQVTCPSLAWLLPARALWPAQEVLVRTDRFNYTIDDLQRFFTDLELPAAWEMRRDTEPYSHDWSAPGVELHCVFGTGVPTVERLEYAAGAWLDGRPALATGDGDGTVNLRSLSACARWAKRRARSDPAVKLVPLPGAEHLQVLHDARAVDYVRQVLALP